MASKRDDFKETTKDIMAKRVGYRCSNPSCRKPTCGASDDPNNYSNIGVAAHICAAARGYSITGNGVLQDGRSSHLCSCSWRQAIRP